MKFEVFKMPFTAFHGNMSKWFDSHAFKHFIQYKFISKLSIQADVLLFLLFQCSNLRRNNHLYQTSNLLTKRLIEEASFQ
mmetsp:Transcript_2963/g.4153  ORF Transcript_2963/g.4153 Transcript_2963/m.4153 type:complete len:80 (-) Transcript_2963:793-1032(-)